MKSNTITDFQNFKLLTMPEKWELFSPFLRQYGRQAFSYATLQQGMEYFVNELGYVAYVTVVHPILSPKPLRIVFCDPVCAESDYLSFLKSFFAEYPNVVFGMISENFATVLRSIGYMVNCLGIEAELAVQSYNTAGNWKELDLIKRARNEIKRKGVVIHEVDITKIDRAELDKVTEQWLTFKSINDREIWIYARKPIFSDENDMRKFIAVDMQGQIVGFVFYDPMYRDGKIIGYSANILRTNEHEYTHLTTAIHMFAIDQFRTEGVEVLNLCLSPFVNLDAGKYNDNKIFKVFLLLIARFGDSIYNFHGLSFHKSKYRGTEKPIYFASKSKLAYIEVYLAFQVSGISKNMCTTAGLLIVGVINQLFRKK